PEDSATPSCEPRTPHGPASSGAASSAGRSTAGPSRATRAQPDRGATPGRRAKAGAGRREQASLAGEQPANRFLWIVQDRRTVAGAEHVEVALEEQPRALPRLHRVVEELVGHEAERLAGRVDEQVGREERVRRLALQERVLG